MSNIADKIARLIAKAESSTHPEEADTFMAKANALMLDHGVSLLDLGKIADDPVGVTRGAGHTFKSATWKRRMANALARYFGCRMVYTEVKNKEVFSVAGRESARVTFTLMLPYVAKQVTQQAREAVNAGEFKTMSRASTAIGNALAIRLARMAQEAARATVKVHGQDVPVHGNSINALVPVDAIQAAIDEEFGETEATRKTKVKVTHGAMSRAAGINVDVQVSGAGGKAQQRIGGQ